jgi:glycosyltransferase involved in cell wall biosynthesis
METQNEQQKKKKILIINDNNLSFLGGERESQLIIINGIKEQYMVSVIQPGDFNEHIDGVQFYSLTRHMKLKSLIKNPFAFIRYIFKVGNKINEIQPDIIHSQSQCSFFIVSLLRGLHIVDRKAFFLHTERGLYTKYSKLIRRMFQFSFWYLDCLVTTTDFNKIHWEKANTSKGINLKYCVVSNTAGEIYENIDFQRIPENKEIVVGFAGRMCDWKGWSLAEEICRLVNLECKESRFKMYISCHDKLSENETRRMFERLEGLLGDRFEGRINVAFAEMEEFYYSLDVFALTSDPNTESFGRTVVEAMSRYTAVLTTNAGGTEEVVGDEKCVCYCAQDFAGQILKWHYDNKSLEREKGKNLQRVRANYTLKNNVEGYMNIYGMMTHGL